MPSILHLDMDAFFASVEQRDNPALRGRPVLVGGGRGGEGKRGVVTTASYEARAFGCRSAMPMARARRLCPHAVVVPVRMEAYAEASRRVMEVLREFTPVVEPVSIDEAFLDTTSTAHLFGDGAAVGAALRRRVREEVNLPASVGVAHNKFLAKLASDLAKPDGMRVIREEEAEGLLAPMSVRVIFGVGPAAAERLERVGVRTIADLRAASDATLMRGAGRQGAAWRELAWGRDSRRVEPHSQAKSVGKERTFGDDVADPALLRATLVGQVESCARRLRAARLTARTVTLKLRSPDFATLTRSATMNGPTDSTGAFCAAAAGLLDGHLAERPRAAFRLIGVALHGLRPAEGPAAPDGQLPLFVPPPARSARLDAAADTIARKFGPGALTRAAGVAAGRNKKR